MTQNEYIHILFNDCGFDTAKQRYGYMSRELNRDISDIDTLTTRDKSIIINRLKDLKNQKSFSFFSTNSNF